MPFTVNGCGTTYSGRDNVSIVAGVCPHCRRETSLTSYDTRLSLSIIFIPILPLRRYRVLSQCLSCRRHWVMPLATFEAAADAKAAPIEEAWSRGDRKAGLDLVRAHLGATRVQRARAVVARLARESPDDPEVQELLRLVATQGGASKEAMAFFEQAMTLAPGHDRLREELAYQCVRTYALGPAVTHFQALLSRKPGHPPYLLELAKALLQLQRFSEAAATFDELYRVAPESEKDPKIVHQVIAAKRAAKLGLSKTEAQRVEARARSDRRAKLVLGGGTLAAIAGGLALVAYLDRTVRVLLDNDGPVPATVELDGKPWATVPSRLSTKLSVPRGRHRIQATAGAWKASFDVDPDPGIRENVFSGAVLACDLFQRRAYLEYQVTYGSATATRPPVYHVCEQSFLVREVDCALEPPPSSLAMKAGEGTLMKCLKHLDELTPNQIAGYLFSHHREKDAVAYLEREIEVSPDDRSLFATLGYAASATADHEAAEAVTAWVNARRTTDASSVNFHWLYQTEGLGAGRRAELEREYQDFRARNPRSAMAVYLLGRVAPSPEVALDCFEKAIDMDPASPWGYLGRGHALSALERFDDAIAPLEQYLTRRRSTAASEREVLWAALVHARQWEPLERDLAPYVAVGDDGDPGPLEVQGRALIAADAGEARWKRFADGIHARDSVLPWVRSLVLDRARWRGDRAAAERCLGEYAAVAREEPTGVPEIRCAIALAAGDRDGAEKTLSEVFSTPRVGERAVLLALLVGIADEWAGEPGRAAPWYDKADEATTEHEEHEICRFLTRRTGPAALARGDQHGSSESRAVAALARALRAEDDAERERLIDVALRLAAWDLSDAAFAIRGFFAKSAPKRP
jgi:tetratricopeptide (TPR) repeat protein